MYILNEVEARVLGSLIEKEVTTPEYYPLSLNALINACNQKSNREPLMNLDEEAVRQALHSLDQQALARSTASGDSRVAKYQHELQEVFNLDRRETAILCLLLLRGSQTPGELRGRSERLHRFDDLGEVQSTLQRLIRREPPLVKMLPRQPGTKEARYAQLLSSDAPIRKSEQSPEPPFSSTSVDNERIARLEHGVAGLQKEIADLRQLLADFRKQFE